MVFLRQTNCTSTKKIIKIILVAKNVSCFAQSYKQGMFPILFMVHNHKVVIDDANVNKIIPKNFIANVILEIEFSEGNET